MLLPRVKTHRLIPAYAYGIRVLPNTEQESAIQELLSTAFENYDTPFFAVEEIDGMDTVCLFLDQINVIGLLVGLQQMNLVYEHGDLTRSILLRRSCGPAFDRLLSEHAELVGDFRRAYLSVNDVLDLILVRGYDGLDAIDHEVLSRIPAPD